MYKIPESLTTDIAALGILAEEYQEKKVDPVQFKAVRVPMGIYEQRQDEVYMSRVRTTGGVIYPDQLLRLIDIAKEHNSDLLHITTRQEIQIQNIDLKQVEPILNKLQAIGLSTKGGGGNTIRNILVSENTGWSETEIFDTTPYAMALTSKLIAEKSSYLLPRKMKIAFSTDDKQIDYAAINDIGFVAKKQDGKNGFLVYAGGGGGAKPTIGWVLFDFIPAENLYIVAEGLKTFFSEHGNRKNKHQARVRFIFYKLGEEETLRLIREYYEKAKETEPLFNLTDVEEERPNYKYTAPQDVKIDEEKYSLWKDRYVSSQKQKGYNTILVPIQLGNIPLENKRFIFSFRNILKFINQFGKHTIRFTTSQNIRLRNIPDEALPELYTILSFLDEDFYIPTIVNNIVSCTGADTCRLGIALSKGLAYAIREELRKSTLDLSKLRTARIHISGCPNSCGAQIWSDIGFSGKILRNGKSYPAYQVYLAANRGASPKLAEVIGSVAAKDVPQFVHKLLEGYINNSDNKQDLTSYLQNDGRKHALQLIEEYKTIPSFEENADYYKDWGSDSVFSVIARGKPECSAGLFDIVELDQNFIKANRAELEKETDPAKRNNLLYDIIFSSSRMLLITRGVESKSTADVFDLFIKNFIEYGFVEDKFKNIVLKARDDKNYNFAAQEELVCQLADRVIELYKNMDDSLQFKKA